MPHPALAQTEHRPWPLPRGRWAWRQSWLGLLFAHWRVDADALRARLPAGLELDTFDGQAWVGVVPFRMAGVTRRPWPDLPWVSAFPELNVRTYVTHRGKPGVWFLSLDATNPLAVWAARRWFHLPYHRATMTVARAGDRINYASHRRRGDAILRGWYRPTGDAYWAAPGTLEHWLTERYCLYATNKQGQMTRTEVHHEPWPLKAAEARFGENTMLRVHGLPIDGPPELLHYAERLDVVVWPPATE